MALLGTVAARRLGNGSSQDAEGHDETGTFEVLRRQGLAAALDALERAAERDSTVMRDAHQTAHALGRQAVVDRGGDASVIRQCSPRFASGCYHGVVEASLRARGRIDMVELERMCAGAGSPDQPGPVFECLHGLGHGVLGGVGMDLPVALRDCDALSRPRFRASCHSGTFMEAISTALGGPAAMAAHEHMAHGDTHASHSSPLAIDPHDPYSPCDRFADPYAQACWLFQGFVILRHNGFDLPGAFHTCDAAPAGRTGPCYESLGHQMTGLFQRDDQWVIAQCAQGNPAFAPRCAGGAALALDAQDWSGGRAARFCAAAPAGWKETCYRTAAGSLADLAAADGREAFCAGIEADYAATCREAAGLSRAAAAAK